MSANQSRKRHEITPRNNGSTPSTEVHTITASQYYSGPLPLPEIMKGYNEIIPGSAERILAMTEKEQSHRHELETQMVDAEIKDGKRGMIFAFVLSFSAIAAAVIIATVSPANYGALAGAILGASGFWGVTRAMILRSKNDNNKDS